MTKTILYIHQSSELYGSDKTLFYLAKEVNNLDDFKVILVLPNEGPLKDLLEENNIQVIISPIIKVSRSMFTIINLLLLPLNIITSINTLNKKLKGIKIDIVHSNTLAVLLGAFYSKRYKIRHIWHVHEIIKKPKLISFLFPVLVDLFSDKVIFNSKASKEFLCQKRNVLEEKSIVVLNGINRDKDFTTIQEVKQIREQLFFAENDDIVLGLVGRINKWKGHNLLLNVFKDLKSEFKNIKLVFVGSPPPNQTHHLTSLENKVNEYYLENDCVLIPFQDNIWTIWDSIDVAVVPSTEPEPFGLVALEAMLAKKPVIAANHGGLVEITNHDQTGYLFEPNSETSLKNALRKIILDTTKAKNFGKKGYQRALDCFSLKQYVSNIIKIYR